MAKTINGAKWVQPFSKDSIGKKKVSWLEKKTKPKDHGFTEADVAVYAVPGQTISVKEIIDRHKKGRPQPQE